MDFRKRVGKFYITREFLFKSSDKLLKQIFKDLIILRTDHDFCSDTILYTAWGKVFDEVAEGEVIPEYIFKVSIDEKGKCIRIVASKL